MLSVDIHKPFKKQENGISLKAEFAPGQITAIYGRSGLGKTTVLRMIAGLEDPDSGTIIYNGVAWFDNAVLVPLKNRPVGMVFQDYNLFRNMTVLGNLVYAAGSTLSEKLQKMAEDLGITDLYNRYPNELSKGQQQKAAILRSICLETEILLLDEPFSALDDASILELINVLDKLRETMNITIVLVTHRTDVILRMANAVINVETGEQGAPQQLLKQMI